MLAYLLYPARHLFAATMITALATAPFFVGAHNMPLYSGALPTPKEIIAGMPPIRQLSDIEGFVMYNFRIGVAYAQWIEIKVAERLAANPPPPPAPQAY